MSTYKKSLYYVPPQLFFLDSFENSYFVAKLTAYTSQAKSKYFIKNNNNFFDNVH